MTALTISIPGPSTELTISVGQPRAVIYDPTPAAVGLSAITLAKAVPPTTVTVDITLDQGKGTLDSPSPPGSVTVTPGDKSLQISGPFADVNTALGNVEYTADTGETVTIQVSITATDDTGDSAIFCDSDYQLVPEAALVGYKEACTETLTASGDTDGVDMITQINLKDETGTIVDSITGLTITWTTLGDDEQFANDIVAAIDGNTTDPDMDALKEIGLGDFTVCLPKSMGQKANGWCVEFVTVNNADVSGDNCFDGGVTGDVTGGAGKTAKPQAGDSLLDDLLELAGNVLGPLASILLKDDATTGALDIPRDEENPVSTIHMLIKGRNTIDIPNNFNPVTGVYTGSWDLTTFTQAFTDDPAWCLLDFITDTEYGCGNIISITPANLLILHQDCLDASVRNNETVNGEKRYTINTVIFNKRTKWDVLQDIASTMHARFLWDGTWRVVQDRPLGSAGVVFNQATVEEPGFQWSGASMKALFDGTEVAWYDLTKHSSLKKDLIQISSSPLPNRETLEVVAWGVSQQGQAVRHGKKLLFDDAIADPLTVTFRCGPVGADVPVGSNISVTDPSWLVYDENFQGEVEQNVGRILEKISDTVYVISRPIGPITASYGGTTFTAQGQDRTLKTATVSSVAVVSDEIRVTLSGGGISDALVDKGPYQIGNNPSVTRRMRVIKKLELEKKSLYEITAIDANEDKWTTIDAA